MFRALPLIIALSATSANAHDHLEARLFVIRSQLAQAGPRPVVFGGDSIIESALLPADICGHRIVNAGIGGATTYDYALAIRRLNFKAAAFVLQIGTNDSTPDSVGEFSDRYRFLSKAVSARSDKILDVGIPSIESGIASEAFDPKSSDQIYKMISNYGGAQFVDIRAALEIVDHKTIDGVHLTPSAQTVWLETVLRRLKVSLGC